MQTATSETESKFLDLSICVHHYTLRAPCPKGQGISRTSTPHTSRATTPHTPAQERDRHARDTQPCGKSEGACTQQPGVDLRKKRSNEDQCACQQYIMHKDSKEKGAPRREDRCSCQTRCTQTASHVLAARATSTYHLQTYHPQTRTSTFPCIIPCGWTWRWGMMPQPYAVQ